ncbi:FkbM family methyltransferase [Haloarcula sp. CBA1122]|uniref:FkbM family methyltransferase n=1 Tax=Haloarcula sp. CBA1122 TaxID=2668069 RepID=UPI002090EE6E|nr:FkbM family methyltransferase [Haloarcula sp. CBA1122]
MSLRLFKKAISNPEYIIPYIVKKSRVKELRYSSLKNKYQRHKWKRIAGTQNLSVSVQGYNLQLNPSDYSISRRLYFGESYEPLTTDFLTTELSEGDSFVDVGANIGYFSLLASSVVGNSGQVIAFEPEPQNFNILERNVVSNDLNGRVSLYQKALADSSETLMLNHHPTNKGMHSIVSEFDHREDETEIEAIEGDSVLSEHIDIIKIDVEGAEPNVIRGLSSTLERCHPTIVFEYENRHWEEEITVIIDMLTDIGYRLYGIVDETGERVSVEEIDENLRRVNIVAKHKNRV